jgi:hypothetical protein
MIWQDNYNKEKYEEMVSYIRNHVYTRIKETRKGIGGRKEREMR